MGAFQARGLLAACGVCGRGGHSREELDSEEEPEMIQTATFDLSVKRVVFHVPAAVSSGMAASYFQSSLIWSNLMLITKAITYIVNVKFIFKYTVFIVFSFNYL